MATKINVRSPYFIRFSYSGLSYVDLDLTIWDGAEGTIPSATYTFSKTIVGSNDYVIFEIADYIRDYIVTEYGSSDVDQTTNAVWVTYTAELYNSSDVLLDTVTINSTPLLAVDGYGVFSDGINPNLSDDLLQSNTDIYYNDGDDIVFAVYDEGVTQVQLGDGNITSVYWEQVSDYWNEYEVGWDTGSVEQTIGDSTDSSAKIVYIKITDTENLDDGETITLTLSPSGTKTLTLHKICEPKYSPYKVVFYNKFGAMQDLTFFKRSQTTLNVSSDTFKRNIVDFSSTPTYNTSKHQIKSFNVNAKETIQLNSGFLPENFNELIEQLLLSEEVWINDGSTVLPVRPATSSLTYKKNVNDKLISYTLDFEYAFDKINNIR